MFKYALVLANMLGLFALGTLMDDGVLIEDNTPAIMQPGQEVAVEITVNKGDVEGFAKLQLELPDGLVAVPGDTKGASFTFSGQKVKFIWMSLPADQEFTVSYKLQALPTASGSKVITGTFSYIKNNQRVDYDLQSKMVEVTEDASASASNEETIDTPGVEGLACVRTMTEVGNGDYLVRLDVVNSDLTGFAKIKENIPSGYTVAEEDSDGAVVTIDDNAVKYVWFDVPSASSFSVSYRLIGGTSAPSVDGVFSYVENNTRKEVEVIDNGIIEASEPLADNGDTTDPVVEEVVTDPDPIVEETTDPIEEETVTTDPMAGSIADGTDESSTQEETTDPDPVQEEDVADNNPPVETVREDPVMEETSASNDPDPVTNVPDPETGVTYKVQIAAAHRVVDEAYFASRHGFNEGFGIENHEGWVKYTTGSHDEYKGARDDRERIKGRYNFRGPFVTAYNEGVRITVQEALMITKQKWYK
ncbi:hypothetical protein [Sanyastnella coralliicola]|uniref:hypothetical protein n=1 Tax=Sanyastnella coralliicola TaxID=3069118 RepID=UPI0027BA0C6A|nr:hypothetical protein [Longitalea sp. SCSIO 12813]